MAITSVQLFEQGSPTALWMGRTTAWNIVRGDRADLRPRRVGWLATDPDVALAHGVGDTRCGRPKTWLWEDAAGMWSDQTPSAGTLPGSDLMGGLAMVFDESRGVVVLLSPGSVPSGPILRVWELAVP